MIITKNSPEIRQLLIAVTVNFTFLHLGLGLSIVSPMLSKLRNPNQTTLMEPLTDTDASWMTSVAFLSGVIAIWFSSYLSYFMGRKTAIILLCIPRLVMCLLYLFATRTWMFILGRILNGISDTQVLFTVSYCSEIAGTKIRGAIGVISQITYGLGAMLLLSVGPYISYMNLQIFNTCLIIATFLPILFIPESPYYLYTTGRKQECIKVLTFLRGSATLAQEEEEEYKNCSPTKESNFNIKQLLKDKISLKALGIAMILAIFSQATGYNIILPYLQGIFETSNTSVSPELSSMISGFIQLFGAVCAVFLIDRCGRKPVLTTSLIGFAAGMIGLGIYFKLKEIGVNITGALNYLPLVSILLVMFCNNIGIGCLTFVVIAEIFEGPLRTLGVGIAQFLATLVVFSGSKSYFLLVAVIGAAALYFIFAGFAIFTCIFIAFCVPETKGKPFSQIQRELGRK